jgi:hypothetical protein
MFLTASTRNSYRLKWWPINPFYNAIWYVTPTIKLFSNFIASYIQMSIIWQSRKIRVESKCSERRQNEICSREMTSAYSAVCTIIAKARVNRNVLFFVWSFLKMNCSRTEMMWHHTFLCISYDSGERHWNLATPETYMVSKVTINL